MADYVKREDVLKQFDSGREADPVAEILFIRRDILNLPAADVVERRAGKWIYDREITTHDGWTYRQHVCSECGRFTVEADNFCPRCGADMRGEEDV